MAQVATRSKFRMSAHPLQVSKVSGIKLTPAEFLELQTNCSTLAKCHELARLGQESRSDKGTFSFIYQSGILYHKFVSFSKVVPANNLALVIPFDCRKLVL